MVFSTPVNTVNTDDRCVNVWSVPVRGVELCHWDHFPKSPRGKDVSLVTHSIHHLWKETSWLICAHFNTHQGWY